MFPPLDGLDHEAKEVEPVGALQPLLVEKVGEGGLPLGLQPHQLHGSAEVVDVVRVDLQHLVIIIHYSICTS